MSTKTDVDATLVVMDLEYPTGYGRIITENGTFSKIVEEKDCDPTQKKITLVNCGVYMFSSECLCRYLPALVNTNAQKEYYLTDLFGMMIDSDKHIISVIKLPVHQQYQLQGVNTPEQLKQIENMYIRKREMI
jgi:bifunctional N-acetylglucosamine-1-phosphate-uridyltransferase/glucosamine-1-phosphate-acetyltransferase GlmU-like protein